MDDFVRKYFIGRGVGLSPRLAAMQAASDAAWQLYCNRVACVPVRSACASWV